MSSKNVGRLLVLAALTALTVQTDARSGVPNGAVQEEAAERTVGAQANLELLTPTEGVDFNGYLRNVYVTSRKSWFAKLPPSVEKGNKGVNVVEFRILQDGTVPKEFVKMRAASGKADLDEASLAGIRGAPPFAKLPVGFRAPYIELRFTFYYNLEPSQR